VALFQRLDDAQVAHGRIVQRLERFLVSRAVVGCDRLGDAREFGNDNALPQARFVRI
jgi:hypothetical protein